MAHALTRNRTYAAVDTLGMYSNIRTYKNGVHTALFDAEVQYTTPPPAPPSGAYNGNRSVPSTYFGWQSELNSSKVDEFSAACWMFAQEPVTEIPLSNQESASRTLMDCAAPLRRGGRRNPSVTSRCGSPLLAADMRSLDDVIAF